MATQADFWGEVGPTDVRTPIALLREQASLLGKKTNYLVEARVDTDVLGDSFRHRFSLIVPSLDNYSYQLLSIQNGINPYPVSVPRTNRDSYRSEDQELNTEEEFAEWLRAKLSSAETKKIIGNLLAQLKS
jgi:hypothetical protein